MSKWAKLNSNRLEAAPDYSGNFLESIVSKMGTVFAGPEEIIIKQGDESNCMYFITRGDCTVDMIDEKRITHVAIRLLVEGMHFGEIGCYFKCKRTATITSRNYNSLAMLSYAQFRDILADSPEFDEYIARYIYQYHGSRKMFVWKILNQIDYLKELSKDIFHQIYYLITSHYL
jgi:CRP-like cAMP-binding protein